ncbi:MAG: ABC transporter permease [Bryobacteraceae bacterium]|nr:ABC transporter permease [Bryobacteraceae bacterium]
MKTITWSTAAKIAWREAHASRVKFFFVVLAVAIGVGALTGVRGFAAAFRSMLLREARTLMAADLSLRQFLLPTEAQQKKFDELATRGLRRTWVTETLTMVAPAQGGDPLLSSIKAVDPAAYPFYGELRLAPAVRLGDALQPDTVIVSNEMLLRLNLEVGQFVRIGGLDFRIAAIVEKEPDRMTGSMNVGPRLMMSRAGLERAGLMQIGSRAAQRYLFQMPMNRPQETIEKIRVELKAAFPESLIADYRETHPLVTRGLNRSTTFLSLVSLIALIVGALGVAMAMNSHLQQRLDSIAIMKCMGATSSAIMRIYALQTLGLGLAGGGLGIVLGAGVQAMFPILIARYFPVAPEFRFYWPSVIQGLATGVLTTVLFTLPPLLSIRDIRPVLILRREMAEAKRRWKQSLPSIVSAVLILIGLGGIAAWLTEGSGQDAVRLGLYFAGGLAVSLLALYGVAWLLLWGLRKIQKKSSAQMPVGLRQGIANLYRPGNQAEAVLVALGVGVMFTLTIYLVQKQMLDQLTASAPPGMANVFLIDIRAHQKEELVKLLKAQKGLQSEPDLLAAVAARITKVNGTPVADLGLKGFERRFLQTRTVTWYDRQPDSTEVLQGLWPAHDDDICVGEDAAKGLKLSPGAELDWTSNGRDFRARVSCVFKTEEIRAGSTVEFIFRQPKLAGFPVTYFGGVRVRPADVPALQRASYQKFPTVTVINVADVIQIVQEVIDQIAVVVRFISAFAILAGVIILASSVAGTRFRRIREVVILKTLGGTRPAIARIFSIEFLILGAVAGLMGGALATGFSSLLLSRLFEATPRVNLLPNGVAVIATALVANLAGWLASFRILSQRPLEVLRAE